MQIQCILEEHYGIIFFMISFFILIFFYNIHYPYQYMTHCAISQH